MVNGGACYLTHLIAHAADNAGAVRPVILCAPITDSFELRNKRFPFISTVVYMLLTAHLSASEILKELNLNLEDLISPRESISSTILPMVGEFAWWSLGSS